jgi:uncharacterized coiled-coil DUF342 family protein
MVHVQGVTEKINEKKSLPFDKKRLQEIERRISFLSWCWDTSNRALIELGQQCTAIKKKKTQAEEFTSFNESMARSLSCQKRKRSVFGQHFTNLI